MSNILPFHSQAVSTIRKPLNYRPGDEHVLLEVEDDELECVGFFAGACFVVLKGTLWDKLIHAVEFGGEPYLGMLQVIDERAVNFVSWHRGEYSGLYKPGKLKILGAVCEVYPLGEGGPRVVVCDNARSGTGSHALAHSLLTGGTVL